jgi:predicted small lipoprotein YifL
MRNAFKIALVALTVTSFAACKGKGSSNTDSVKIDSTKKDTTTVTKIDSSKKDTSKVTTIVKKDSTKKM